jgi:hypothetical protein
MEADCRNQSKTINLTVKEELQMEPGTVIEILSQLAEGLIQANEQVDMKNADIAVQEQYRRNADTILNIAATLERDYSYSYRKDKI